MTFFLLDAFGFLFFALAQKKLFTFIDSSDAKPNSITFLLFVFYYRFWRTSKLEVFSSVKRKGEASVMTQKCTQKMFTTRHCPAFVWIFDRVSQHCAMSELKGQSKLFFTTHFYSIWRSNLRTFLIFLKKLSLFHCKHFVTQKRAFLIFLFKPLQ